MADYYVYENWRRKRGAIHLSDCSYCNEGRGTQAADGGQNGKWHGPFASESSSFRLQNNQLRLSTLNELYRSRPHQ
jgi:hypothetical protein